MSNYITERSSVTEAVERVTVRCSVAQSEPPLLCRAVFYCGNNKAATLNLSSGVTQNFTTDQPCNVTIQVVSPNNISQVLEEAAFYNISPSVIPTDSPSSPSPSSPDSELFLFAICDCYIRVFLCKLYCRLGSIFAYPAKLQSFRATEGHVRHQNALCKIIIM